MQYLYKEIKPENWFLIIVTWKAWCSLPFSLPLWWFKVTILIANLSVNRKKITVIKMILSTSVWEAKHIFRNKYFKFKISWDIGICNIIFFWTKRLFLLMFYCYLNVVRWQQNLHDGNISLANTSIFGTVWLYFLPNAFLQQDCRFKNTKTFPELVSVLFNCLLK